MVPYGVPSVFVGASFNKEKPALSFLQDIQIQIQPFIEITAQQLLHGREAVLAVIRVEGAVVGGAVREFDVDRRIPRLHQFQIHQESPGPAISIDKGVDPLKLHMEPGELRDDVIVVFVVPKKELPLRYKNYFGK